MAHPQGYKRWPGALQFYTTLMLLAIIQKPQTKRMVKNISLQMMASHHHHHHQHHPSPDLVPQRSAGDWVPAQEGPPLQGLLPGGGPTLPYHTKSQIFHCGLSIGRLRLNNKYLILKTFMISSLSLHIVHIYSLKGCLKRTRKGPIPYITLPSTAAPRQPCCRPSALSLVRPCP